MQPRGAPNAHRRNQHIVLHGLGSALPECVLTQPLDWSAGSGHVLHGAKLLHVGARRGGNWTYRDTGPFQHGLPTSGCVVRALAVQRRADASAICYPHNFWNPKPSSRRFMSFACSTFMRMHHCLSVSVAMLNARQPVSSVCCAR